MTGACLKKQRQPLSNMLKTSKEGVMMLYDSDGKVVGLIHKDPKTHFNIIRKCPEMSFEEIGILLEGKEIKLKYDISTEDS